MRLWSQKLFKFFFFDKILFASDLCSKIYISIFKYISIYASLLLYFVIYGVREWLNPTSNRHEVPTTTEARAAFTSRFMNEIGGWKRTFHKWNAPHNTNTLWRGWRRRGRKVAENETHACRTALAYVLGWSALAMCMRRWRRWRKIDTKCKTSWCVNAHSVRWKSIVHLIVWRVRDKNRWVNARTHTRVSFDGLVWQTESERCQRIQREYVDGMVPLCIKINSAHSSPPLGTTRWWSSFHARLSTHRCESASAGRWCYSVCARSCNCSCSCSYKCLFASVRDSTCASSARVQVVDLSSLVRHRITHDTKHSPTRNRIKINCVINSVSQLQARVPIFFGRRFTSYSMNELNLIFVLSRVHSALCAASHSMSNPMRIARTVFAWVWAWCALCHALK